MNWLSTAFGSIVGFLPDLLGGLVVLVVGWLLAVALSRLARPLLHRMGFDRLLAHYEIIASEHDQAGSRAGAAAVYWVVIAVALLQAARIWRLDLVTVGLARVVGFLPNILAAVVIFGASYMAANFVRRRMRAGERRAVDNVVASGVRAGILTLGAFLALRELRIGEEILVIAFAFSLGAIAVAVALAFGLGSRAVAGRIAEDWYERRASARRVAAASEPAPRPPDPRVS